MEKYSINGVEMEYDTFDLDAMELLDSEVNRIRDEVEAVQRDGLDSAGYIRVLREQGENILDFFDTVLGDGAAAKIFGTRMNIRDIMNAYRKFTADVAEVRGTLAGDLPGGGNREQRRAAEREQRRRRKAAVSALARADAEG